MRRSQRHVRAYVSEPLYVRILREAAARGTSVSLCLRADLEELYTLRDEVASLSSQQPGDRLGLLNVLVGLIESRVSRPSELASIGRSLRRIEAMIDRHYAGTMIYLPPLSEQDVASRTRAAATRYEAWQRAVDALNAKADEE